MPAAGERCHGGLLGPVLAAPAGTCPAQGRPCRGRPVPEEFRSYLARNLPPRPGGMDRIEDLWPRFWQACLTAFIECDTEARRLLQTAFPNEAACYPPEFAGALEQARRIAAADPERFQRMLDRSTGYGYRI